MGWNRLPLDGAGKPTEVVTEVSCARPRAGGVCTLLNERGAQKAGFEQAGFVGLGKMRRWKAELSDVLGAGTYSGHPPLN